MSPPTPCTPRPHAEGRHRQGLLAVGSGSVGTSTRGHRPGPGRAILSSAGGRGLRRRQLCPVLRAHRNACRDSGGGVGALSARAGRDCLGVSSAPSFLRASQRAGRTDGRRPGQEGLARPAHAHHGTLTGRGAPLHKGRRAEPVSDRPKQALVWACRHRAWGLHRCGRASAQHELLPPGLTLNSSDSLLPCRGTRSSQPSPPSLPQQFRPLDVLGRQRT